MTDQPGLSPQSPVPSPPGPPATPPPVAPVPGWAPAPPAANAGPGKSRMLAAALALVLGGIGIHKFYLGKVGQGILYLVFFWTGIPALVGWVEGILYLLKSDAAWAAEYGGSVERPSSLALGCLWLLALLPLLSFVAIVLLIFLGSAIGSVSSY